MNDILVTFLASFLIWFMVAGLFILWFIDGKIKKEQVLHALFAITVSWVISEVFKSIFPVARPYVANGFPTLTVTTPNDGAFPSSHSAVAFSLATSIWYHDKRVGRLFLFLALLVGAGRVLANVHFPLDVLGGAVLGMLGARMTKRTHIAP